MGVPTTSTPGGIDRYHAEFDPAIGLTVNSLQRVGGMGQSVSALSNIVTQTIPDYLASSSLTLTAGTVFAVPIWLNDGEVVNNLSVITAVTAASTPTNQWAGLASFVEAPVCLATSADGLTTAIAADTLITFALASAYTATTAGFVYAYFCVAGTTGPTIAAAPTLTTHGRGAVSQDPPVGGLSGDTSKSTPYAVAGAIGEFTAAVAIPLVYVN